MSAPARRRASPPPIGSSGFWRCSIETRTAWPRPRYAIVRQRSGRRFPSASLDAIVDACVACCCRRACARFADWMGALSSWSDRVAGPAHDVDRRRRRGTCERMARRRARPVRRAPPVRASRGPWPAIARRGARRARPCAAGRGGARRVTARAVLDAIASGVPTSGPRTVHVDVTNACNAACITCWDHSPLLRDARSAAWKKQRWDLAAFEAVVADLAVLGSVHNVDPARGWAIHLVHLGHLRDARARQAARLAPHRDDQPDRRRHRDACAGRRRSVSRRSSRRDSGGVQRVEFTRAGMSASSSPCARTCAGSHRPAPRSATCRSSIATSAATSADFVDMVRRSGASFRADHASTSPSSRRCSGGTEACRRSPSCSARS